MRPGTQPGLGEASKALGQNQGDPPSGGGRPRTPLLGAPLPPRSPQTHQLSSPGRQGTSFPQFSQTVNQLWQQVCLACLGTRSRLDLSLLSWGWSPTGE